MKKILVALMMVAGMFAVGTAPAEATYVCSTKLDRNSVTFPDDELVHFSVFYRYCIDPDPDKMSYVKPKRVIVTYNMPGTHMRCGEFVRKYDGVKYNWYFWRPFNGVNFNPKGKHIPCDESTINSSTQKYKLSNVPRLYFGPGYGNNMQPRWKINITLQMNAKFDQFKSYAQDFKP